MEALKERGLLTDEQEVELRPKVVGRDKEVREMTELGVGGAQVADRGVGPEGVSGWAGADQVGREGGSADVDLDAWLARVVPDELGVQVPQGRAADAGVMLGEGAYEEFVATELPAFLGQDAGDDAVGVGGAGAVASGSDFAGFLSDFSDGEGSVGVFGGEGADGLFFGEPFAENAVWPDAGDATESAVEQEVELAELRPKAQQWQKKKKRDVEWQRVRKAVAARVAELERLEGLTEEQEAELAELRSKVPGRGQKKKDRDVTETLTGEQEAELAELRPKAQQRHKEKKRLADRYREMRAAAARIAVLETLKERGPLTV
ncbi:hypothetical protein, partial [Saccharopolyspora spinosa]|uniref:hypothetical protein n=1 Tax=Saccharopolyspora spinosa TaxID=60894 RepID=UPI00178C214F